MRIAVDAMGGDHAPHEIVAGSFKYAQDNPSVHVVLVGQSDPIQAALNALGATPSNIFVQHASDVVSMNEHAAESFRLKPNSSISVAVGLVARKECEAVISAGNTGAFAASAMLTMGMLEGVKRAGIAVPIPTKTGFCMLIDAGANIHCKPLHLMQYGIMGAVYSKCIKNVAEPKVGLLNIGEEAEKGNELVKQTLELFKTSHLNFVGYVEGQDLFRGNVDVIVCEGFLGNVLLKASEGMGELVKFVVKDSLKSTDPSTLAAGNPMMDAFGRLQAKLDYAEYGGAPLLGVNGITIICHGRSRAKAITNAIKVGVELAKRGANTQIKELVAESMKTNGGNQ